MGRKLLGAAYANTGFGLFIGRILYEEKAATEAGKHST